MNIIEFDSICSNGWMLNLWLELNQERIFWFYWLKIHLNLIKNFWNKFMKSCGLIWELLIESYMMGCPSPMWAWVKDGWCSFLLDPRSFKLGLLIWLEGEILIWLGHPYVVYLKDSSPLHMTDSLILAVTLTVPNTSPPLSLSSPCPLSL